jgi:ATP-dependent RNA helicase DeaD
VQAATVPVALTGQDLIVQAKTGSGKTLAFVLPLLKALESGEDGDATFAVILTPTRELATQICKTIESLTDQVKPSCLIGGVPMNQQIKALDTDHRVIVGTPGRTLDHLEQRTIVLKSCKYFVLDEADEMLSMDFLEPITAILKRIPEERQGLLVSATITSRVEALAGSFLHDPARIILNSSSEEPSTNIEHLVCEVGPELPAKMSAVCDVLETENPRSAIIFCNTKSDTELVEKFLRRRGFDARCINSDLSQKQRDYVMSKIRARELRYLVGTDIAARGIDIEQIDVVINYSLPMEPEAYTHRTGRTGRAGRSGKAISILSPHDFPAFSALKRHINVELKKFTLPTEQQVLEARVTRFLELLEHEKSDIHARDVVLAEELLRRKGLASAPIDASTFVATLCRFMMDHLFNFETHTLEEEMDKLKGGEPSSPSKGRESREPRREREGDRGGRGGRGGGGGGRDNRRGGRR